MSAELTIQGKTVQNIFEFYTKGLLTVNRRYQRKLVWDLQEKEKFIDSLLNGFPIPMVLTSKYIKDNLSHYEILDGMQRLNAITSFIEGEFSLKGKFFDLQSTAQTIKLVEENKARQNEPRLTTEQCAEILNYQIPFSTTSNSDETVIDETFRRINTGGRRLSKHDVRQAGSLGEIPSLINECAAYIRKDSSHSNIVDLRFMKNISIGNRGLNYGIPLHEIFWSKHEVINGENIRSSRDEELIAHLISYILSPTTAQTTSEYLDRIYSEDTEEQTTLTMELNKQGKENIFKKFCYVFDEIEKTLHSGKKNFRSLVFTGKATKSANAFQVIFLAFYNLLINEQRNINNTKNICNSLADCYKKHMQILNSDRKWANEDRASLIDSLSGIMRKHTTKSGTVDRTLGAWVANLENILNESRTEQQYYDFKSGLVQTTPPGTEINIETFKKIIKTLTAMTNSTKGECKIILGIAESADGAKNHKTLYGEDAISYSNFFITGIHSEAKKLYNSLDTYERKLIQLLEKEPISAEFKSEIKSKLVTFTYKDKEILMFRASRIETPQNYDGNFYRRTLSNNEKIPASDIYNFMQRFSE
ncbi:DUF262 domain-containing protein [Pseudomonas cichorii]|uniref:DUF262 domain-containing protein n=1 Tax=Pseudomonas cichorii TaxID=36746 RepID=UPI001C8A8516|nr:DUF262 domain-containing protein [Pseudomonas cichorii]MBX8574265.1 DUF262 domain-containing protein [Pseudomonas cichorii]